jgi:hypothetical protein
MAQSTIGGIPATPADPNTGAQVSAQKRGRTNPMDVRDEAVMQLLNDILECLQGIQQFMIDNR